MLHFELCKTWQQWPNAPSFCQIVGFPWNTWNMLEVWVFNQSFVPKGRLAMCCSEKETYGWLEVYGRVEIADGIMQWERGSTILIYNKICTFKLRAVYAWQQSRETVALNFRSETEETRPFTKLALKGRENENKLLRVFYLMFWHI